jgi:glutamate racemase
MIGLFDSGVGGLSILREVRRLLPRADLLYLADQAHAPYGERSLEAVRTLADRAAARLIDMGATTVVVACNTASAAALTHLRQRHPDVTFVGMEPAVKPAAAATRTRVVGVLATPATFQAEVFDDLVGRYAAGIEVIPRPCPGWADMVEANGARTDPAEIHRQVSPLVAAGADTLVLACTHYSFLADAIAAAAGPGVAVVDPAPAVARQTARVADGAGNGPIAYFTSGNAGRFAAQVAHLLGENPEVTTIAR